MTLIIMLLLCGMLFSAVARAETSDNPFADGSLETVLWIIVLIGVALVWLTPHGNGG